MTSIALLRGINVSGRKIIKMTDLINIFEKLKFKNIKSYIQSGNIIFDHEQNETSFHTKEIEYKIQESLGIHVNVIIRTMEELENIINHNPFLPEKNIETNKLHVTLLNTVPNPTMVKELLIKTEDNERYQIIGREIFIYCPNGYGRSKLTNTVFEKKLGVIATTRNWNTTIKLLEMAKGK